MGSQQVLDISVEEDESYAACGVFSHNSSGPNFQNVPKHSAFGKGIRRAVIARPGYQLLSADFSQLELRICLYLAGFDPSIVGPDCFAWLVENSDGRFDEAAGRYGLKARDVAKSVAHGGNYLEGFVLLMPWELQTARVKEAIAYGALEVHWDWHYCGGVVAFSGVNVGERLFGDKSLESRKRGLAIQSIYFTQFPQIRAWQRKVLEGIETNGYVQLPTGRYLALYDTPAENAKKGVATLGQGTGAEHVTAIMLRFCRETGSIPLFQVHDDVSFEVPIEWDNKRCEDFMSLMREETWRLPGFKCATKIARGLNWADLVEFA